MIDQNSLLLGVDGVIALGGFPTIFELVRSLVYRNKIVGVPEPDVDIALLSFPARKRFESMRTKITDLETRLREAETQRMAAETRAVEAETRLRQLGGAS